MTTLITRAWLTCTIGYIYFILAISVAQAAAHSPWRGLQAAPNLRDEATTTIPCPPEFSNVKPHFDNNNKCNKNGAPDKQMDKAWLTLETTNLRPNDTLLLAGQISNCWKCCLIRIIDIYPNTNCTMLVDTKFDVDLHVFNNNDTNPTSLWHKEISYAEHGHYKLLISGISDPTGRDTELLKFNLITLDEGGDSNIPIYVCIAISVTLSLLWILVRFLSRKGCFYRLSVCCTTEGTVNSDLGTPPVLVAQTRQKAPDRGLAPPTPPKKNRVKSLDAFRGFSLTIMIFVNYGGGGYWFFNHSYWNGLTLADLVFPWFVWIIGTSIAISFNSMLLRGATRTSILVKVIRRTVILFVLGLVINSGGQGKVDMTELRIPGVLQRLAASYCVVALLETVWAKTGDPHRHKPWAPIRDLLPYWPEWVICLGLVATYLAVTFSLAVPGCPKGYLGPGGISENGEYANCTGGAAGYVDRWLLGASHIYQTPTTKDTYQTTVPYDPEGILGTLCSIVLCFLGLQAGKILIMFHDWPQRVLRWSIWGIVLGAVAAGLSFCSQNDGVIPVNKNLWSVSFILALGSMAFILLTIFYILIDVTQLWSGAPFFFPGMNSIVVYFGSEILQNYFPISWQVPSDHASLLALDLWGCAFWVILSMLMFYKKIFIAI